MKPPHTHPRFYFQPIELTITGTGTRSPYPPVVSWTRTFSPVLSSCRSLSDDLDRLAYVSFFRYFPYSNYCQWWKGLQARPNVAPIARPEPRKYEYGIRCNFLRESMTHDNESWRFNDFLTERRPKERKERVRARRRAFVTGFLISPHLRPGPLEDRVPPRAR